MDLEKDLREAVGCLAISIKSIRDDDEIDADEQAELIDESQQQFTKHVTDLVITDARKRAAVAEAKVKKEDTMSQVHQFKKHEIAEPVNAQAAGELIKLAKSINAGTTGNHASKSRWYETIKRLSEQDRQEDESREQAFARYIQAGDGRELFKAYQSASGPDFQPVPEVAAPVVKADSAYVKLKKLAADLRAEEPTLSEHQAFAKVFTDPKHRELAELSKRENSFA